MNAPSLDTLALTLHDILMAVAPRGWQRVELPLTIPFRFEYMVASTDGRSRPYANLGSVDEYMEHLGETLSVMPRAAEGEGVHWSSGGVALRRGEDGLELQLISTGGSVVHEVAVNKDRVDALCSFNDALLDELAAAEASILKRQRRLDLRMGALGECNYQLDLPAARMVLDTEDGRHVVFKAETVCYYDPPRGLLIWGWAVSNLPVEATAWVRKARERRASADATRLMARPHLVLTDSAAYRLACLAVEPFEVDGIYRFEAESGVFYLTLEEQTG